MTDRGNLCIVWSAGGGQAEAKRALAGVDSGRRQMEKNYAPRRLMREM